MRVNTDWFWFTAMLLAVGLHFWFPSTHSGPVHDSYSVGAAGKKAMYLLAARTADSVERNTTSLSIAMGRMERETTLCLLGPARYPNRTEWQGLIEWVRRGGCLVIAANDSDPAFSLAPLDIAVKKTENDSDDDIVESPDDKAEDDSSDEIDDEQQLTEVTSRLTDEPGLAWKSNAVITAPKAQVLVDANGSIQAVQQSLDRGTIVVIASDFVFSNQSLEFGENANAVLAVRLLESAGSGRSLVFDESLNQTGTPKVVGVLLDPVLRPMTIQLVIVLILFGWWRNRRFGPLLAASYSKRHNIVDHTDAVGILHYKTKQGREPLHCYATQLVAELKLKHHKGREERVLAPIARRLDCSVSDIKGEFRQVRRALKHTHVNRKVAAELIRRMARIRRAARRSSSGSAKNAS